MLRRCRTHGVGGEIIHVDIMDAHLVPNLSIGVPVVEKLHRHFPDIYFDTHLMIDEPVRYAPHFIKAGSHSITFHVEAPEVKNDLAGACKALRAMGVHVGITLKPGTPIEMVFPVLDQVEIVLIMSVEPGFGGQKFMPDQLEKARKIKPMLKPHQRLEIDGGINAQTIAQARQAGIEWFVVGSALFDAPDRDAVLTQMKNAL